MSFENKLNKLKLNSNKTETLVFSSSYCRHPALNNLVIASETVNCSTTAKNIGVIFNNSLSMLPNVTAVCKSSFFHLRNIFKIRKFLSYDTCNILIHTFITSRIDYCNSLLHGQPKCILQRLQSVLNSAAKHIHLSSRCEHVTPLLIGSLLNRESILNLLSLHSRLFMVLHSTISLRS